MNAAENIGGRSGVHWDSARSKWFSKIHINGKSLFLGRFKDKSDAIELREKVETAISLLEDLDAENIHISNAANKTIAGILSKNGFKYKFEIQINLPRTSGCNTAGGDQ